MRSMNFHYLKTAFTDLLVADLKSEITFGFPRSYRRLIIMKSNCAWRWFPTMSRIKFLTAFPWYSRAGFSSGVRQLDSRNRVLADDETVYLLHLFDLLIFPKP
jgi:hypothetical protein